MKLTTPPTASAPYTAEAPPEITSTRWIADDGNRVRIDDHRRVDRHRAPAVDEHEVPVRAEAAQADRRCADRVGGRLLHVARRELRDGGHELR